MSFSSIAYAINYEAQCFNAVQGKIAWNDDKNMSWEPANIQQLCKGTTNPTAPGECFVRVFEGHMDWGKGTDWDWRNVINLCSGSSDAQKSADCFKKAIATGADWRDAILICQRAQK